MDPMVASMLQSRSFDFVVLQDHTQAPARRESRRETILSLQQDYAPDLTKNRKKPPIVILLQTYAYKNPHMRGSQDLGGLDSFTDLLAEGYREYQACLCEELGVGIDEVRIAPMGEAVRYIYYKHAELFPKLYSWDEFHPSPYGTYLQACVLLLTIARSTGTVLPTYDPTWWNMCRYLQPPNEDPLPRPSSEEAAVLAGVAESVCRQGI